MPTITLYALPQVVNLTLSTGGPTVNYPLTRSDFRIHKGVRNVIDVRLRDIDRKAVAVPAGAVPTLRILDTRRTRVLLTRALTPVDTTRGLWQLTVEGTDCADWAEGFLIFTVTLARGAVETMLYADTGYGGQGAIEVMPGPIQAARPALDILPGQLALRQGTRYGSAIPGDTQVGGGDGTYTGLAMLSNFTGTIGFQAYDILVPTADDTQWSPLFSTDLVNASGTVPLVFSGAHYWVRLFVRTTSGSFERLTLSF